MVPRYCSIQSKSDSSRHGVVLKLAVTPEGFPPDIISTAPELYAYVSWLRMYMSQPPSDVYAFWDARVSDQCRSEDWIKSCLGPAAFGELFEWEGRYKYAASLQYIGHTSPLTADWYYSLSW